MKKIKAQKLKNLEDNLRRLQKEHTKSLKEDTKAKILILKKEIDEINIQEIQKKLIFTKQRYYEAGGKSLKLLSYKLRKQQADRTIHRIRNPTTN